MIIFTYEIDESGDAWIEPANHDKWNGIQYSVVKMEPFGTEIICFEILIFDPNDIGCSYNTDIYSRVGHNHKGAITLDKSHLVDK